MKCMINGDEFNFDEVLTLSDLLQSLELDQERIIVEWNDTLVKNDQFSNILVRESDRLELLEFVGGG
ncbi:MULTISPECIES: sulfur carrier protein ThiS [Mammaliicoccus]|uniref:Sulfur carrier protein ThiS n=1 Tax=Mammaliicoccus fleurettii TaxID=150056 RepID=A0ABS5MM20_9STAP|nr:MULTISPECIES: sulfur carrier protein ThiS [Mammaliicoccus]HCN60954.1 thiamine biosynthesis protein ThiS [Staphylococcus sp.]MBL0847215.1 sulfur carrier protein ThiS [Mammaliicoccus fleurettii]MBO3061546.1 sulfur carrier protein ThiS [Mammaliicoccus fleurettii]MBS3672139.1 sulfur carrier protein ThiS [Mammaliicoccus fleurettii]MBS3696965.1 sulfur carrier protein ThiS [Mammaliicoccus fleurettii]